MADRLPIMAERNWQQPGLTAALAAGELVG